ncbi:hypothetical protein P4O66_002138 [Electrophorus voltai]|uniref:Uncharacterized protein n=1 Tax=Electrophorus voltai TaxID=2609070 RepID=A0AAD8Z2C3_9TELE|nr:hypothetical protein P4O66_002138 [Electrophorus voltai]
MAVHRVFVALRRLRDFRLPSEVLRNFYTCTIESILTGNITVWFGNSIKQDRQALQRVVRSAERITHTELPDLQTIYYKQCQTKARRIVKDPTHLYNRLFALLRSGKCFCSLKTNIEEELLPTGHSGPESGQLMNCRDYSVYSGYDVHNNIIKSLKKDDDDGDKMTLEFPGPLTSDDRQETDPDFSQVGHAVDVKETYDNMKQLLDCLEYSKYGWHICSDLKQSTFFALCEERLAPEEVYEDWREECAAFSTGRTEQNASTTPTNHLGLMKNLAKAMDQNGSVFKYLSEKFPQISKAKIKEGMTGPQIRQLFIDEKFDYLLIGDEKKAWDAFRLVSTHFLGNVRAGNYKELVKDMLSMHHKSCTS